MRSYNRVRRTACCVPISEGDDDREDKDQANRAEKRCKVCLACDTSRKLLWSRSYRATTHVRCQTRQYVLQAPARVWVRTYSAPASSSHENSGLQPRRGQLYDQAVRRDFSSHQCRWCKSTPDVLGALTREKVRGRQPLDLRVARPKL